MDKKKLVLPGEYLLSSEEAEPGQNTYTDKDEIFSATMGTEEMSGGKVSVRGGGKALVRPHVGMEMYCIVNKASLNKAVCTCVAVSEIEGKDRSLEIMAVLPVKDVRKGYVNDLRDVVRIGDIIKARISKVMKTGIDISMIGNGLGVIYARPRRGR